MMKPFNKLKVGEYTLTKDEEKRWTIKLGEDCFVSSNDFSDINVLSKTIKNKGLDKDMKDYLVASQIEMMNTTKEFNKCIKELRESINEL